MVDLKLVAVDSRGRPVSDLTSDNFRVTDAGKPRRIVFFQHNDSKLQQPEASGPNEFSNRVGAAIPHVTSILFKEHRIDRFGFRSRFGCRWVLDHPGRCAKAESAMTATVTSTATLLCFALSLLLRAQTPTDSTSAISNDRILGVIPNFQAVTDPSTGYTPLHARDKWKLFVKETVDPYTFASAAAGAAISQIDDRDPKYGRGLEPYFQRFGAAQADVTTKNFFGDAVLASLFREDPRYFRKGKGSSVLRRIGYALSRTAITRTDSGHESFNFSGILGMGMGIALSDAYYPRRSVGGRDLESRMITSVASSALGNLLPEFWPDIKEKLASRKHK
jgi:hypothetical protein